MVKKYIVTVTKYTRIKQKVRVSFLKAAEELTFYDATKTRTNDSTVKCLGFNSCCVTMLFELQTMRALKKKNLKLFSF